MSLTNNMASTTANAPAQGSAGVNIGDFMKELETGVKENLSDKGQKSYVFLVENYILITGIFLSIIILLIIFFTSKTFRVGRHMDRMKVIERFQELRTFQYSKFGNVRLCDCRINSSYNSAHAGYQMFDYTSEDIVLRKLQCGVRYFEFNIFNSEFGEKAIPVVSNGYKVGEWKLMLNNTPLEFCFDTIAKNAFKIKEGDSGVPNPEDPIFIGLNLNTNNNLDCLNILSDIILDYFRDRLLHTRYSYQSYENFPFVKLNQLMEKVVIFSSDGFQGSGMEELVNYCWDNVDNNPEHLMQRIHYSELEDENFNYKQLVQFNKKGITIIIPHKEGDFYTKNFNPMKALNYGCQFVAMDTHEIDYNLDTYISLFKSYSILIKPKELRSTYKKK